MGRYYRPLAAWPGDIELLPHLKDILAVGAIEVEVCFGEAVEYSADTNRKQVSVDVADRIRAMLSDRLLGRPLS
jgi:1-acyl-sn-glycerol-3-phosphate acyltransferase